MSVLQDPGGLSGVLASRPNILQTTFRGMDIRWLLWLVSFDLLFIGIHAVLRILAFADIIDSYPTYWLIDRDRSIPEIYSYFKWAILIWIFWQLYLRSGALIYAGLCALWVLALADDSLQFHENFENIVVAGTVIERDFPKGTAEVIYFSLIGIFCIIPIIVGWLKATKHQRNDLKPIMLLFAGLIFCVVVVDVIHVQMAKKTIIEGIFGIIEDGGEMIFLSLMISYAVGLLRGKSVSHGNRGGPEHRPQRE